MPANVFGVLMSLEPAVAALAGFRSCSGSRSGRGSSWRSRSSSRASIGVTRSARAPASAARRSTPDLLREAPCRHTGRGVFGLNLPNFLTVLRILLVPVLVVALLGAGGEASDVLAAVVFAIASVTDAIDGWIARSREEVTTFGKLMDPVADKLLVIAALLSLVSLDRLEAWVAMVIIAREFAVTVARMQARAEGVVIAANWWGKAKTARPGADDLPADPVRPRRRLGRRCSST